MIRKENVEIKEMNRKMISRAAMKPDLNAFPVKDISVPFNSSRNTPGLREMALEKPVSFLENNLGIARQIEEIRNNRNVNKMNNSLNNANLGLNNANLSQNNANLGLNNANLSQNNANLSQNNANLSQNNANLELKILDLEDDYQNNVSLSPAETFNKVKNILNNIKNEIALENELEEQNKPKKNIVYLPPGVSIPRPPSDEEMMRNTRVVKRNESNNLVRSIMDIKRGSSVSKQLVILFFVVMAILIYSGQHKKLLR